MNHVVESGSDKGQKEEQLGINIDQTAESRAMGTSGFNDDKVFKLADDLPGGDLEARLLDMTLQQVVGQQSDPVEAKHGSEARLFV